MRIRKHCQKQVHQQLVFSTHIRDQKPSSLLLYFERYGAIHRYHLDGVDGVQQLLLNPSYFAACLTRWLPSYVFPSHLCRLVGLQKIETLYRSLLSSPVGTIDDETLPMFRLIGNFFLKIGLYHLSIHIWDTLLSVSNDEEVLLKVKYSKAVCHDALSEYVLAEKIYVECIEALDGIDDATRLQKARYLDALGLLYTQKGDFSKSEEYLRASLELQHDQSVIDKGNTLHNLGNCYLYQGKIQDAYALYQTLVQRRTEELGADDLDTLASCAQMASTLRMLGRDAEALAMHQDIFKRRKQLLGSRHPNVLYSMYTIGWLHFYLQQYTEACGTFEHCLALQSAVLGSEHIQTLGTKNGLATVYEELNKEQLAMDTYKELLAVYERKYPTHHNKIIMVQNNLALMLKKMGEEALSFNLQKSIFERALQIFGQDHPDTLIYQENLALTYKERKDYKASLELSLQVLKGRQKVFGQGHALTLRTLSEVSRLYAKLKNKGKEYEYLQLLLRCYREYQSNAADYPFVLNNTAWCAYGQGCHTAKELFEELQQYWQEADDWKSWWAKLGHAMCDSLSTQSTEIAESILGEMTSRFGPDHPRVIQGQKKLRKLNRRLTR